MINKSPPPLPPPTAATMAAMPVAAKCGHKTLTAAANLANLLPTGTVLAFQTLLPSSSNNGTCQPANKLLTLSMIVFCSLACFLSSFTDSFVGRDEKLCFGIATINGLYIFNDDPNDDYDPEKDVKERMRDKYRLSLIDFVHAFSSLVVFLVFAISSSDVQSCFFPKSGPNEEAFMVNLPLGAGILGSLVFMVFPTKRRGIGYADMAAHP